MIQGITEEKLFTLGTVNLNFATGMHKFHVVPKEFPLKEQGIIRSEFLRQEKAFIDFNMRIMTLRNNENVPIEFSNPITIPGRSICPVIIQTKSKKDGPAIINRTRFDEGVFLADNLVKVKEGQAITYLFNITEEQKQLELPIIETEPVVTTASPRDSPVRNINTVIPCNMTERLETLKRNVRLEHLQQEEIRTLWPVLEEYNDIFYLPGDKLLGTDRMLHSIPTIDENPINVKQFRYPPVHKEEIKT